VSRLRVAQRVMQSMEGAYALSGTEGCGRQGTRAARSSRSGGEFLAGWEPRTKVISRPPAPTPWGTYHGSPRPRRPSFAVRRCSHRGDTRRRATPFSWYHAGATERLRDKGYSGTSQQRRCVGDEQAPHRRQCGRYPRSQGSKASHSVSVR